MTTKKTTKKTSAKSVSNLIPPEVRQFEGEIVEMAKAHDLDVGQMARLVYAQSNKLTLKKDGVLALAVRHPEYGGHKVELLGEIGRGTKGDGSDKLLAGDFRAVVTLWRKGTEREDRSVFEWSLMDAWTAGLLSKSNYKKYPKDMCLARCLVRAVKAVLPDALLGLNTETEVEHLEDASLPKPKPKPKPKPTPEAPKFDPETGFFPSLTEEREQPSARASHHRDQLRGRANGGRS